MRTSEEIIKEASNKNEAKDYSLLELHLFLVIKQILRIYFNNQITKEQAVKLKQQAVKEYEMNKKNYEFQQSMFQEHIRNMKDTEMLRNELNKLLNDGTEVTIEKLSKVVNICLEIIQITYKERF